MDLVTDTARYPTLRRRPSVLNASTRLTIRIRIRRARAAVPCNCNCAVRTQRRTFGGEHRCLGLSLSQRFLLALYVRPARRRRRRTHGRLFRGLLPYMLYWTGLVLYRQHRTHRALLFRPDSGPIRIRGLTFRVCRFRDHCEDRIEYWRACMHGWRAVAALWRHGNQRRQVPETRTRCSGLLQASLRIQRPVPTGVAARRS